LKPLPDFQAPQNTLFSSIYKALDQEIKFVKPSQKMAIFAILYNKRNY